MAGEWIKFRAELWTHPRFIALSNALIYGKDHGMLIHACGEDALEIGVMPPSSRPVTDRALRCVTEKSLREVTMCALLRVWGMVNSHCKVHESDAICAPMSLSDLDGIAGFSGFGEALQLVGWVAHDEEHDSLIFHNFLEYNEPACLRRKPAMTNAERQAKYREKRSHGGGVTKSNESNAREEKRREEVLHTPHSPPAGKNGANGEHRTRKKPATRAPDSFEITEPMWSWAQEQGVQHERIETETAKFLDHHKAVGSAFSDWPAAWRKWMRNVVDFAARKH